MTGFDWHLTFGEARRDGHALLKCGKHINAESRSAFALVA